MIAQVNVKQVRDDMRCRYQSVGVMSGLGFYDWVARIFPKNLYAVEEDRPKRILPVPVLAEPPCSDDEPTGFVANGDGEARESTTPLPSVEQGHSSSLVATDSRGGQKFDRKAYMKDYMEDYRKKPVVCPACGHTFKELKRVKE